MKKVGNRKKRWLIGILLAVFAFAWMPKLVSMENNITEVEAAKPKISAKKVYLIKGLNKQLKVSGYQGKIKWSSSNKKQGSGHHQRQLFRKKAEMSGSGGNARDQ